MLCYSTAYKLVVCCRATLIKDTAGVHDLELIQLYISNRLYDFREAYNIEIANFEALLLTFRDYDVLAFRHSDDDSDWRSNYNLLPNNGVHSGYLAAAKLIYPKIQDVIAKRPFYITGHSLGGALTIALTEHLQDHKGWLGSYAYGCPKLLTPKKLRLLPQDKLFVFRKALDIVPFLIPGYIHPDNTFYIDEDDNVVPNHEPSLKELLRVNWRNLYEGHHVDNYIEALDRRK